MTLQFNDQVYIFEFKVKFSKDSRSVVGFETEIIAINQ